MIQVPQRGPGCQHFLTCASCLTAPKFMDCGWCSGVCSWESECHSHWRNDSCPPGISGVRLVLSARIQIFVCVTNTKLQAVHLPVLSQFFPRTAPPDGQTELTVCGWEFQSPLRPAITTRTHQVRLGQTHCIVQAVKSNNTQWVTVQGLILIWSYCIHGGGPTFRHTCYQCG